MVRDLLAIIFLLFGIILILFVIVLLLVVEVGRLRRRIRNSPTNKAAGQIQAAHRFGGEEPNHDG